MARNHRARLNHRALHSLPVNSGVKPGAYPQPRFWTYLTVEDRSRLDLQSFFQGKSYAARIVQDKYGYTLMMGELSWVLMTRPTKEECVMRIRHYLPDLLRQHFEHGSVPPVPSLSYDECRSRPYSDDESEFRIVEDIWIMVDFSLPGEEEAMKDFRAPSSNQSRVAGT
ncbi:hypothetical protein KFL_000940040 [Klebsormidium nitens]|uniref:Uncharacterized protein n=1 Tax=Klebsormidium nitens TaxID=105231 RepID=A0A1Y1HTE5_KLENI|nr:hypothetical protein KFL_000940040 [Klebsormidium nitens]|eukprot:GAQ81894.1 hypothetical protein KFL_000940040 [Klebsormidium nitens]